MLRHVLLQFACRDERHATRVAHVTLLERVLTTLMVTQLARCHKHHIARVAFVRFLARVMTALMVVEISAVHKRLAACVAHERLRAVVQMRRADDGIVTLRPGLSPG